MAWTPKIVTRYDNNVARTEDVVESGVWPGT